MDTATLETSGRVECAASFQPIGWAIWTDLDAFTQGYVEALFADAENRIGGTDHKYQGSSNGFKVCVRCGRGRHFNPGRNAAFSDLAPEALAQIIADCAALLSKLPGLRNSAERGAGFWNERQAGYLAKPPEPRFPPLTPYLADDGKVHLREAARG